VRVLVDRYLTSQAEVRLKCHVLGRYRPCDFGTRKDYAGHPRFVPVRLANMVCGIFINFV
jgi:hypothetical protein